MALERPHPKKQSRKTAGPTGTYLITNQVASFDGRSASECYVRGVTMRFGPVVVTVVVLAVAIAAMQVAPSQPKAMNTEALVTASPQLTISLG